MRTACMAALELHFSVRNAKSADICWKENKKIGIDIDTKLTN